MGELLFLDCWKWGPYGVPDQQGDAINGHRVFRSIV